MSLPTSQPPLPTDLITSFLFAAFVGGSTMLAYVNLKAGPKRKTKPTPEQQQVEARKVLKGLSGGPLPKMAVFDLDFTLWPLFMDTHVSRPILRPEGDPLNLVKDPYGYPISFFPHVPQILLWLKQNGVKIGAASRTLAPPSAHMALRNLLLPDTRPGQKGKVVSAFSLFDFIEIYPGSKIKHFGNLHKDSSIPFEDMLFFDDEERNGETERLGLTFVHAPNGVDVHAFQKGLLTWRNRKASARKALA